MSLLLIILIEKPAVAPVLIQCVVDGCLTLYSITLSAVAEYQRSQTLLLLGRHVLLATSFGACTSLGERVPLFVVL